MKPEASAQDSISVPLPCRLDFEALLILIRSRIRLPHPSLPVALPGSVSDANWQPGLLKKLHLSFRSLFSCIFELKLSYEADFMHLMRLLKKENGAR